jgi:hypothetical protein
VTDTPFGASAVTLRLLGALAVVALLGGAALNLAGATGLAALSGVSASDFDMFHVVARLALAGRIEEAYDLDAMLAAQIAMGGVPSPMTWTYPPPFDLALAPLGLLGRDTAYAVFAVTSLALYLGGVARLAGRHSGAVLFAALPAAVMSVSSGQNGLLMAGIAALACGAALRGRDGRAGAVLGLLVVKPHLGLGLGVWCLAAGRWRMLAAAAAVAALACAASVAAFGADLWGVFLAATGEAAAQLAAGAYPAHRMASLHAALTSLGLPHGTAIALQAAAGLAAAAAVAIAARRLAPRRALAVALFATPLFSPYLYDYDLALYGPALALLLPELDRAGRRALVLPAGALAWIAGGTGLLQNARGAEEGLVAAVTGAGFAALALAVLAAAALWQTRHAPGATTQRQPAHS